MDPQENDQWSTPAIEIGQMNNCQSSLVFPTAESHAKWCHDMFNLTSSLSLHWQCYFWQLRAQQQNFVESCTAKQLLFPTPASDGLHATSNPLGITKEAWDVLVYEMENAGNVNSAFEEGFRIGNSSDCLFEWERPTLQGTTQLTLHRSRILAQSDATIGLSGVFDDEDADETRNSEIASESTRKPFARKPYCAPSPLPEEWRVPDNPIERHHIDAFAKLLLVMFLFDCRKEVYILVGLIFILYTYGLFDLLYSVLRTDQSLLSLEQTLNMLRHRRDVAREVQNSEQSPVEQTQDDAQENPTEEHDVEPVDVVPESEMPSDDQLEPTIRRRHPGTAPDVPGPSSASSPAPASAFSTEQTTLPPQEDQPERYWPPLWQRFIYQLCVMFWLTLLPWWSPDSNYVQ